MNELTQLISLIGSEKTLVITCFEKDHDMVEGLEGHVCSVISGSVAGRVRGNLMGESVRHYLENKQCTRIIVVAKSGEESVSVFSGIQFNLAPFLGNKARRAFAPEYLDRVASDQLAIQLSRQLMDHDFIRERIDNGWLTLAGISIAGGESRHIFCNGVVYNDLVTSN